MQTFEGHNNVVPLSSWKSIREAEVKEKSMSDYLKVLSFHDLLVETEEIIKEINSKPLSQEITLKSKQLLREVNQRLQKDSDGFANALKDLRLQSEKTMFDIKGLL